MAKTLYANNVAGQLAANIGPSDNQLLLAGGQGAAFPSPAAGDWFYATLVHGTTGEIEIVQVTSRSVDTLTITRGADGTSAKSFTSGSLVEMRLVSAMLRELDYRSLLGQPNGIAALDGNGKIPDSYLSANVPLLSGGKLNISTIPDAVATDAELASKLNVSNPTATGTLSVPTIQLLPAAGNGGRLNVGDDAYILDIGQSHTAGLQSITDANQGYLRFGSGGLFGYNGSALVYNGALVWHGGNFDPNAKLNSTNPSGTGTLSINAVSVSQDVYSAGPNLVLAAAAGAVYLRPNGPGSSAGEATIDSSGLLRCVDLQGYSDRRMKTDIIGVVVDPFLADRVALFDFKWIATGAAGRGPIAQEVAEYAPRYVHGDPSSKYSIDKAGLALEAVVGLAARLRKLEEKVNP